MGEIIQSAGGIIYYLDTDGEPRYLLIKRHALSGRIERVAPKGKIEPGEDIEKAAIREVSEETGIPINQLKLKQKLGVTQLRNPENKRGQMEKDVTYFLIEYTGEPDSVHIEEVEGYIGIHKWATIADVLSLLYYQDIRELVRQSYILIKEWRQKRDIKQEFMQSLD